jgi:hypothetical protein
MTEESYPKGTAYSQGFDTTPMGSVTTGWKKYDGTWAAQANTTSPLHPTVMQGQGRDALASLVANEAGTFTDVNVSVDFNMIQGEHPQGAGLVWHFQDDQNYNILRYSISEQGWHVFTMIKGTRDKRDAGTLANGTSPQFNEWHHLTLTSIGGHVKVWDGDTQVIDYTLPSDASHDGRVGIFVRGTGVAQFDNFAVKTD